MFLLRIINGVCIMIRNTVIILLLVFFTVSAGGSDITITPGARHSDVFTVESIDFNKKVDLNGQGEVLEVQMVIKNLVDDPQELYIFTVATYEVEQKTRSSFERLVPEKERIRNFVPYPYNPENFKYPVTGDDGEPKTDKDGEPVTQYVKAPKDPMEGVSSETGEPYFLEDEIVVRTYHLSPYRNNYLFFNEVAVIIFDKDGEPIFRQLYALRGYRR